MTPLFLFSLPRSGSTLVQRVLASSPEVATVPEPWVLLPLLGMRQEGTYAKYGHKYARRAIDDFVERLDGKINGFDEELRQFVNRLYERASGDEARYFLDKTPRYHTIAPRLLEIFPDAKAIILWRNPLSIVASMIETWGDGRWNLYRYRIDLYHGLPTLIDFAKQQEDNIVTVRYEDLVRGEADAWNRLCAYLGIDKAKLRKSPPSLGGEMGDPNQDEYDGVSQAPIEKWRKTLRNPLRKWWIRSYMQWLGEKRLRTMGYSFTQLENDLRSVPQSVDRLVPDLYGMGLGILQPIIEHHIFRDKIRESSWTNLMSHY